MRAHSPGGRMITAYFDLGATYDSAESGSVGVIGMGGYVASAQEWSRFDRRWRRVLRDNDVDVFHMTDYETGHIRGIAPYCTWNSQRRIAFIRRLLIILGDTAMVGVASAVVRRDYDALTNAEQARFGLVYRYFAATCMAQVRTWLEEHGVDVPVDYVFELGDEGQGEFRAHLLEVMKHEKFRRVYRVRSVSFKGKRDAPALQASDFAAFEMCKAVPRAMGEDARPRRRSLEAILERVPHVGGFHELKTLREFLAHKATLPTFDEWIKRP